MNNVLLDQQESTVIVTINRPDKLNALNSEVIESLNSIFDKIESDNSIQSVILTGSGEKAFIAGADIKQMSEMSPAEAKIYAETGQALTLKIENCSKPVIAAVNGFALGGGCEFAMACHFRYAAETARFGQPEVGLGLIAGFGGTQRMPRLVGKGMAMELLLSGKMISAEEAMRIGLVNAVMPLDELLDNCKNIASKINQNSPNALSHTIKTVNEGQGMSMKNALEIEANQFENIFESSESKEGLNAFLEKRKPEFSK